LVIRMDDAKDEKSPFVASEAEEEYEELLLSPERRNRLRNRQLRRVQVGIRVRPFLPHEESDSVLVVRGKKNLMLVNPLVFPGASSELVSDMVLAGSKADMDLSDWVRPFEFGSCLWSLKQEDAGSSSSSDEFDNGVPFCDQTHLYEELGKPLVDSLFNGVHISAFAYGMTGSGKTYSMIGADPLALHLAEPAAYGLIPSALIDMMDRAAELWKLTPIARTQALTDDGEPPASSNEEGVREDAPSSVSLRMTILEVYNDRLRDLLSPNRDTQPLRIREDPANGPYATGLESVTIDLSESKAIRDSMVLQLLSVASAIRVTADNSSGVTAGASGGRKKPSSSQQGHETSSRGHALVNVDLEVSGVTTRAQLVDLAGSERGSGDVSSGPLGKRGRIAEPTEVTSASAKVQQQRQRERIEIGRSLSNLNVIINGLTKGDDPASLPFRECKMTWLLKQGLAMDAHVVMLGTVSPSAGSYEETMQTLLYAERLQRMKTATSAVPLNQMIDQDLVASVLSDPLKLLQRIHDFQQELHTGSANTSTPTRASATDSSRKASMRGLEVSDPRQRLVRLTDFLQRLADPNWGGPDSSSELVRDPLASPPARTPSRGRQTPSSVGTPSRNSVRAQVLGNSPPTSPLSQQARGLFEESINDPFLQATAGTSHYGDPRVEVSRLRHANANLEMEIHAVKVDRDVLELRVKESQADVLTLRERCKSLADVEARAESLAVSNSALGQQLNEANAELEALRKEMTELREDKMRCSRKVEEKEAEMVHFSQRFEQEEEVKELERNRLDRLNGLATAWFVWRSAIGDWGTERILAIESGNDGPERLTPPGSPSPHFR